VRKRRPLKVRLTPKVKKEVKPPDDSDSDDSSEDDTLKSPSTPVSVTVQRRSSSNIESVKKMAETVSKVSKAVPDSDGSDSETPARNLKTTASEPKPRSDDSSDGESSDSKTPRAKKAANTEASKETTDSDDSDSSDNKPLEELKMKAIESHSSSSKSEVEVKPVASQFRNNKRKSQFGDSSENKRQARLNIRPPPGWRTDLKGKTRRVFVGNLNYNIDDEKIREFFKHIGEITDIFWLTDRVTGDFKGAGFITFETVEAATKAVEEKQGQDLMRRPVKMDWTQERKVGGSKKTSSRTPDWVNNPLSKRPENCTTVFLGNLDFKITEDDVRKHFKNCGELKSIRWVEKDGDFKGAGFAEFESFQGADNAVKLCGKEIVGRAARVDYAKDRPPRDKTSCTI